MQAVHAGPSFGIDSGYPDSGVLNNPFSQWRELDRRVGESSMIQNCYVKYVEQVTD
jgi:hypothetical protein